MVERLRAMTDEHQRLESKVARAWADFDATEEGSEEEARAAGRHAALVWLLREQEPESPPQGRQCSCHDGSYLGCECFRNPWD